MNIVNVVFGQEGREAQVHLSAVIERLLRVGCLAIADGGHGPLQHLRVKSKANTLYLATLTFTKQLSGTADLQVVGGQHKAGAQSLCFGDGIEPFRRIAGYRFGWGS